MHRIDVLRFVPRKFIIQKENVANAMHSFPVACAVHILKPRGKMFSSSGLNVGKNKLHSCSEAFKAKGFHIFHEKIYGKCTCIKVVFVLLKMYFTDGCNCVVSPSYYSEVGGPWAVGGALMEVIGVHVSTT